MGQPITVVERASHRPGIVRFEINRPLSGMGHERYVKDEVVEGSRPVDELARRVFDHGGVDAVHINGSVITVDLAKGGSAAGLADLIRDLFIYYREPATPIGAAIPTASTGASVSSAEEAPPPATEAVPADQ